MKLHDSAPRSCKRVLLAPLMALLLFGPLLSSSASASPETLRLAFGDTIMGIADVLVSPVTGGLATRDNLKFVSDNPWLQGVYAVPGFVGLMFLQAGQGTLRVAVGGLTILPGMALMPFSTDVDLNVFRRGDAPLLASKNGLADKPPWVIFVDTQIGARSPWAPYRERRQSAAY